MIEQFKDEYRWLSNFTPCEIVYENLTYNSVEHFYVAMKSTNPKIRKALSEGLYEYPNGDEVILETPGQAKRFGRKFLVREDWDDIKVSTMEYALRQKYSQEPYKTKLLETGEEKIQEGNTWGDKFWGVDIQNGEGRNTLGKLLMEIRKNIKD